MTTTRLLEPSWSLYRGGEEPRVGDVVKMEGAPWQHNGNGCLALVERVDRSGEEKFVIVIWLEDKLSINYEPLNVDVWPKFLVLVRRAEYLMSWI